MNGDTNNPPTEGRGHEKAAQKGRVEFRMVTDDQQLTPEIRQRIVEDLKAYRDDNLVGSKPMSWGKLAELGGISASTMSEVIKDDYQGDTDSALRKIDQFLADERVKAGRFDFRTTARLSMTEAVFGTIRTGIRLNTMPVIIGSPGVGKSAHMRAFMVDRSGVVIIRIDEANCNARGVTKLLCNAIDGLRQFINKPHSVRLLAIKDWLRKHGSAATTTATASTPTRSAGFVTGSNPSITSRIVVRFGDHPLIRELYAEPRWTWLPQTTRNQANNSVSEFLIVRRCGQCP